MGLKGQVVRADSNQEFVVVRPEDCASRTPQARTLVDTQVERKFVLDDAAGARCSRVRIVHYRR